MKTAYFDCPSGASGDMILGAVVDAGAPFDALERELAGLGIEGYRLERREVMKAGFRATKVDVHVERSGAEPGHHHHPERTLATILGLIEGSRLAPPVRERAARIFRRLAEAEAHVHGTTVERVHFHDVGAVDAIVDVTGACIGLHLLGIEAVHVGALPVGGGFVEGPHGRIPVPGPATAELLKGFPTIDTGVRRELVTPTGAAVLTTLAAGAGAMPAMHVQAVGYGAGTMDLDTPNVLRLFIGETALSTPTETIVQVETTVDDMSPQLYEPLLERLLEARDHEAEPARRDPDRALRAAPGGRPLPGPVRGVLHDRGALDRLPAGAPRSGDRASHDCVRSHRVQGVAPRGPRHHGDARVRGGAAPRARQGATGPRGPRAGARRRPPTARRRVSSRRPA